MYQNIYWIRFLFLLVFSLPLSAWAYQEQSLEPMVFSQVETRSLATKQKAYPILDEIEELIFPRHNFHKDSPGKRLERLEIAVFGQINKVDDIQLRLDKLRLEIESWQIAHSRPPNNLRDKPRQAIQQQPHQIQARPVSMMQTRKPDYSYMNYRMGSALMQNLGRRTINHVFKRIER